jgi:hypothetical protein
MDGISRQCPVECLVSLLSRPTLDALISGLEDATVGQVIELHERGLLGRNYNIGSAASARSDAALRQRSSWSQARSRIWGAAGAQGRSSRTIIRRALGHH